MHAWLLGRCQGLVMGSVGQSGSGKHTSRSECGQQQCVIDMHSTWSCQVLWGLLPGMHCSQLSQRLVLCGHEPCNALHCNALPVN